MRYKDGKPLPMSPCRCSGIKAISASTAGMASRSHADQSHPPSQAQRKVHAKGHRPRKCRKSAIRARIEHVFAHQKNRFGLFIRTIGIKRAEAKLTLANLAYNFNRLISHERRAVKA
ncbi:transposase [Sphingobium sp. AR-3-1]|uniref:Transposase n=1 Tax=Sphingobium psychrophilum TaxID=2728834 RepID=A0A7X9ZUC9_9SPHN|nr:MULTISPECIES: hypothetical protein [Sphingobium]NML13105.1 transposase [Sphingobium psychrophilum]